MADPRKFVPWRMADQPKRQFLQRDAQGNLIGTMGRINRLATTAQRVCGVRSAQTMSAPQPRAARSRPALPCFRVLYFLLRRFSRARRSALCLCASCG